MFLSVRSPPRTGRACCWLYQHITGGQGQRSDYDLLCFCMEGFCLEILFGMCDVVAEQDWENPLRTEDALSLGKCAAEKGVLPDAGKKRYDEQSSNDRAGNAESTLCWKTNESVFMLSQAAGVSVIWGGRSPQQPHHRSRLRELSCTLFFCSSFNADSLAVISRSTNSILFCERNSFTFAQNIQPGWLKRTTFLLTETLPRLLQASIHFRSKSSSLLKSIA